MALLRSVTEAMQKNEALARRNAREEFRREQEQRTLERASASWTCPFSDEAIATSQDETFGRGEESFYRTIAKLFTPQPPRAQRQVQPAPMYRAQQPAYQSVTVGTQRRRRPAPQTYANRCSYCPSGGAYSWRGKYYCEAHKPW